MFSSSIFLAESPVSLSLLQCIMRLLSLGKMHAIQLLYLSDFTLEVHISCIKRCLCRQFTRNWSLYLSVDPLTLSRSPWLHSWQWGHRGGHRKRRMETGGLRWAASVSRSQESMTTDRQTDRCVSLCVSASFHTPHLFEFELLLSELLTNHGCYGL